MGAGVTSTKLRTRGIRRSSQRQAALAALAQAGGSMQYDDFRRVLAAQYSTKVSVAAAMFQMHTAGFIQHRVHLTATGSALLAKTAP